MHALLLPDHTLPASLDGIQQELSSLDVDARVITSRIRSLTPIVQNSDLAAIVTATLADSDGAVVIAVGGSADAVGSLPGLRTLLIDPPITEVASSKMYGRPLGRPGEEAQPSSDAEHNVMSMMEEQARDARLSGDPYPLRHIEEAISSTAARFPLEDTSGVKRVPTLQWAADFANGDPRLTIWSTRTLSDELLNSLDGWPMDHVVQKPWGHYWWWADPQGVAADIYGWLRGNA